VAVSLVVILIGVAAGLVSGVVVASTSTPDLDDPHIQRNTIRRAIADHSLVRLVARAVPRRAGPALAEAIAIAAVLVVGGAVVIGITLAMIRTDTGLARIDTPIAEWAAQNASEGSTTVMRELSKFGGTAYVVVAAVAVAVYSARRDRGRAAVLFVVVAMIGQFLVSNSIKWSVDRARPTLSNLTGFAGTSFPSGHAVAGAAVWTSVAFLLGRGRSRTVRGVLFGVAVGLGVIVAGTRVALGVHWTTDVIIGVVIGWAWFVICALLFGGRRLQPADPVRVAREDTTSTPPARRTPPRSRGSRWRSRIGRHSPS
jgi:undecaprenyl-diphosphatase